MTARWFPSSNTPVRLFEAEKDALRSKYCLLLALQGMVVPLILYRAPGFGTSTIAHRHSCNHATHVLSRTRSAVRLELLGPSEARWWYCPRERLTSGGRCCVCVNVCVSVYNFAGCIVEFLVLPAIILEISRAIRYGGKP